MAESANPVKLFGKWALDEVHVSDISLQVCIDIEISIIVGEHSVYSTRVFCSHFHRTTSLSMVSTLPSWLTPLADTNERDSERLRYVRSLILN